jgi:hypothetical protein
MHRPQFRLSTLLWLTLAVACWFGGMAVQQWLERERRAEKLLGELRQQQDAVVNALTRASPPSTASTISGGKIEETYDKFDDPPFHESPVPEP